MGIIVTQNVKRGFRSGGGMFWALGGISIDVAQGSLTILRGRSGSGKTTLMNILGGLDQPTEGEVLFDGEPMSRMNDRALDKLHRTDISFVFQSVALVGMMTALENVEYALRLAGYDRKQRTERAQYCLKQVGLLGRAHHMSQELSGGEQQRVAIARAMAKNPKVIFADEPTAELDTHTGLQVVSIFRQLVHNEGATVVMTTHDVNLMQLGDKVYELQDGRVINVTEQQRAESIVSDHGD